MNRPAAAAPDTCGGDGSEEVGRCFNDALLTSMWPYVLAMGVGLILGAISGVLLSRLMLGARRPARRSQPTASKAPATSDRERWIVARYAGSCGDCGVPINVGDRVLHRPRHTVCSGCG